MYKNEAVAVKQVLVSADQIGSVMQEVLGALPNLDILRVLT